MDGSIYVYNVMDIVRYNPILKTVKILYDGKYYLATLSPAGIEPIPRPDMYSALWFRSKNIPFVSLDDSPGDISDFSRYVSVILPYPKSLTVQAEGSGSIMNPLICGCSNTTSQEDGTFFVGPYNSSGKSFGMFIDENGNVTLSGNGSSITIGDEGIIMTGKKVVTDGVRGDYGIFTKSQLSFLPSTIISPIPSETIDTTLIDKIKSKFSGLLSLVGGGDIFNVLNIG